MSVTVIVKLLPSGGIRLEIFDVVFSFDKNDRYKPNKYEAVMLHQTVCWKVTGGSEVDPICLISTKAVMLRWAAAIPCAKWVPHIVPVVALCLTKNGKGTCQLRNGGTRIADNFSQNI